MTMTLEAWRARQLATIEKWVCEHIEQYKMSTFDNYWKTLEINHATITGANGTLCNVLILNNEYTGFYAPSALFDVWETIEKYLHRRNLPDMHIELRGCNQSLWIYFG